MLSRRNYKIYKRSKERQQSSEQLKDEDRNLATGNKEILLQIENYYSDLYSWKERVTEDKLSKFTEDLNLPRLSNEESESF